MDRRGSSEGEIKNMYTVLRFYSQDDSVLLRLGEEVKACKASFSGLDKAGGRFSISVSETSLPVEHMQEILSAITHFYSVIESGRKLKVRIEVDTALEPEDLDGGLYTEVELTDAFMRRLSALDINYRFTVYAEAS